MFLQLHSRISIKAVALATLIGLGMLTVSSTGHLDETTSGNPNDILIIANNSVSQDTISIDELSALFLKMRTTVGGTKFVPINAPKNAAIRLSFQKVVLGMTPAEENTYWEEMKIKKGLLPTVEFRETLKAVFSVKDSIGYCYRSEYKEGLVKVLRTL